MIPFAALVAALAFAGAPTSTPVTCDPGIPGTSGQTHWSTAPSDPSSASITVGSGACAAVILLSASPAERTEIAALNPGRNMQFLESNVAALLHEASHVALQSLDETRVECNAMRLLPDFLAKYVSGQELSDALAFAKQSDAFLPPSYHAYPCA